MLRNLSKTPSSAAGAVASSTLDSSTLPTVVSSVLGASFASGEVKRIAARSGEGRAAHGDACQAIAIAKRKTAMRATVCEIACAAEVGGVFYKNQFTTKFFCECSCFVH